MPTRLTAIVIIAVAILVATPGGATAACVQQSEAEWQARAEVIVDGLIVAGAKPGKARLRVSRYPKGDGPRELIIVGASGVGAVSSVDIDPSAGERWRIFGPLAEAGTVVTSVCDGSALVDELEPSQDRAPAATVASAQPSDGRPAWLDGLLVAVATAGLGLSLRWSRSSKRPEPDVTAAKQDGSTGRQDRCPSPP